MKICKKALHEFSDTEKQCPLCKKQSTKQWKSLNKDREKISQKEWQTSNKEYIKIQAAEYYKNNKTYSNMCSKLYRINNKEKLKVFKASYYEINKQHIKLKMKNWKLQNKIILKKWEENNKALLVAKAAKYRAAKLNATPLWLSIIFLKHIEEFYSLAKELQWLSDPSDPLEIDHIVPLQGENVSGLHVPWNLQILPRSLNRKKSNFCLENL